MFNDIFCAKYLIWLWSLHFVVFVSYIHSNDFWRGINNHKIIIGSKGIFNFGSNRDKYGNIIKYDDWLYGEKTTNEELLASGNLTENHLYGGSGDDFLLVGYNAHNYFCGGAGDDTLVSAMIGFKNESAGIDYSKGSSYLNGGEGFDTYSVKDYVTIEDDDGLGEIETKYGKLSFMSKKILSNGTIIFYKNNLY